MSPHLENDDDNEDEDLEDHHDDPDHQESPGHLGPRLNLGLDVDLMVQGVYQILNTDGNRIQNIYILKSLKKNTIFNEHPVSYCIFYPCMSLIYRRTETAKYN